MNVTFLNHSDSRGGASVVTMRLVEALARTGTDARLLVMDKTGPSLRVAPVAPRWRRRAAFLATHLDIWLRNNLDRTNLFKISTLTGGVDITRHPWVRDADVIVLEWVNQGMVSARGLRRLAALGKPLVWVMHDQWPMTGVCHYDNGCTRWRDGHCGHCPLVRHGRRDNDLSRKVHDLKQQLYDTLDITWVAVSRRLARMAAQSTLMCRQRIVTIPNAFPVERFPAHTAVSRRTLGLPDGPLVTMGAARLDDHVKNLPLAVSTMQAVNTPGATLVLYGDMRDPSIIKPLGDRCVWLGPIDQATVAAVMAHSHAVLSTSRWETLPGTLVEGISAGAMAIATDNGGQADIIDEGITGYIAPDRDPATLAMLVDRALAQTPDRHALHRAMQQKFAAPAVARQWLNLLENIRP